MASTDDWSTNAPENTEVGGVFIGEQCPPGNLNNMGRAIMAEAKAKFDSTDQRLEAIEDNVDPTLLALAALVGQENTFPYFTGEDQAGLAALTPFARTLLDDPDAASAAATIGAVRVTASSIAANGYLALDISGTPFVIQWGSVSCPDGTASFNFPRAFSSFSRVVISGGSSSASQQNGPFIISSGTASFAVNSHLACTGYWIAVGR